jgi:hypothetical protein
MSDRKPITIQIEVTIIPELYEGRLGDRGEPNPSTEDVYWEVEDAITMRFGGDLKSTWLNKPES